MLQLTVLLQQALPEATVLALAAYGELLLERSGRINLGLEGLLYFAYGAAAAASVATGSPLAGVVAAIAAAFALNIIYYSAVELLGVDQVVTGLALVFLGMGLGDIAGNSTHGAAGPTLPSTPFYISTLVVLPMLLYLFLYRHWRGYALRSLGEDEEAAKHLGISSHGYRLAAVAVEAVLVGLAAAFFLMGYSNGRWTAGRITGKGWLALGMVILGYWNPVGVAVASYLLGLLYSLQPLLPSLLPSSPVYTVLADAAPYLAVIVALAVMSRLYERRGLKPPAAVWRA